MTHKLCGHAGPMARCNPPSLQGHRAGRKIPRETCWLVFSQFCPLPYAGLRMCVPQTRRLLNLRAPHVHSPTILPPFMTWGPCCGRFGPHPRSFTRLARPSWLHGGTRACHHAEMETVRVRCWHPQRDTPPFLLDTISQAPGEHPALATGPGLSPQPTTQQIDAMQALSIQTDVGDQGAARGGHSQQEECMGHARSHTHTLGNQSRTTRIPCCSGHASGNLSEQMCNEWYRSHHTTTSHYDARNALVDLGEMHVCYLPETHTDTKT